MLGIGRSKGHLRRPLTQLFSFAQIKKKRSRRRPGSLPPPAPHPTESQWSAPVSSLAIRKSDTSTAFFFVVTKWLHFNVDPIVMLPEELDLALVSGLIFISKTITVPIMFKIHEKRMKLDVTRLFHGKYE